MAMNSAVAELKRRLDAVICPVCTECRSDGTCGLEGIECPITTHLNGLVEIAATVDDSRMDSYLDAVRGRICSSCQNRLNERDDACHVRDEGHCALDAYLLPALQVVEDFIASIEDRAGVGPRSF